MENYARECRLAMSRRADDHEAVSETRTREGIPTAVTGVRLRRGIRTATGYRVRVTADEPTINPDVLIRRDGHLGRITLNHPRRINALTVDMVHRVSAALSRWATDTEVGAVLIDGAGERGLCAGADIRELHKGLDQGTGPATFLADEYRMNLLLSRYPKPVVAYMSGLTLGGGLGISGHCSVRVVSQDSQIGMPETAIGLCPDVGGLYLLSRAPGELGTHAALTGCLLGPGDAVAAGLADHFVPRSGLDELTEHLRAGTVPSSIGEPPPAPELAADRGWIDRCYAGDDVASIVSALRAAPEQAAQAAAGVLDAMSPTALKVTLRAVRLAASMTLDEVLEQDFRLAVRFLSHPDLAEGIRAQVIDKDRNPRWKPARLDEVGEDDVDAFFAELPEGERWRPAP
jgi:enoyl-CoA hydratase